MPPLTPTPRDAVRLFLSYAPADEKLVARLETHLAPLEREGSIQVWGRRHLVAGAPRNDAIRTRLDEAELIAILVSPDYLAADDCYAVEMSGALARHDEGRTRVIPILLRPVIWEVSPLARLAGLPANGQAISTHRRRDEALRDVAEGLRRAATELRAERGTPHPADRLIERVTRRIVARSRAPEADPAGIELYVASKLFDVTLVERAAPDRPAREIVERIVAKLDLPTVFDHRNRIRIAFTYRLLLDDRPLDADVPLAAQGVSAGAVLTLEAEMTTTAATAPLGGPAPVLRFRGGDASIQARVAAWTALRIALRAAGVAGETTGDRDNVGQRRLR